ncbi:SDR family oxidoreductase [Schaalia sp. Marseille-Q2122]|uniref:SDR family oxidoreductase n=1 Tax=Schaalia sp. Marseille-Q2122 TaxID=2736604 RepID=UPI00158EE5B8|nr:SDR family oxidoreductase [Schaalia sp. Marseille-Q2122]
MAENTPVSRRAVVTGASTGIGEATVRLLCAHGWQVVALARRADRLQALAEETGCQWASIDLRDEDSVRALAARLQDSGPVDALVNNAGGALGTESIADADPDKWLAMFDRNVMTALHATRAFLPAMRERGGDLVFLTSTAAHDTYPGGGGYVAAKHAERIIANTLRQELVGEPVRVMELAPGMVKTEEFALNRLGSSEAAAKVYEGVAEPLVAEDVAEAIVWMLERPRHVNIDSMIIRPRAQATNTLIARQL